MKGKKMPRYRLRVGQSHYTRSPNGSGIKLHKSPEILELTESQAHGIRDKIDLIDATEAEKVVEKEIEEKVEDSLPEITGNEEDGFDVINKETGKPLNDAPMNRADADALAEAVSEIDKE